MINVKERFGEFKSINYFSRVDNSHILELHIGLDEKGRKAIELRALFIPRKITGTSAIEVNQYKKAEYNTIRFSLCDEEISGLYYKFCDDLIEQTRELKDPFEGYQAILNRFFQWKKLFVSSKKNFLTEPETMGLIGEILFLKDILALKIGLSNALKSWSGQELTHKDFSYENTWYEVKSIFRSSQTVKISSLEQLDSDVEGELVVFALEKMSSAYNGITLNKLIVETRDLFISNEEKEVFYSKVALQGYEYNNYYDDFVYELSNTTKYIVKNDFPKLTRKNLPFAIRKVLYEISLIDIKDFEIRD
jgi:hypothetical protein